MFISVLRYLTVNSALCLNLVLKRKITKNSFNQIFSTGKAVTTEICFKISFLFLGPNPRIQIQTEISCYQDPDNNRCGSETLP